MRANTRIFGEIEVEEEKIISFTNGIIGFPNLRKFTLIFDEEKKEKASISWLQSLDDPELAFPVMDPLAVCPDYNPSVEDELLKTQGEIAPEHLFVLVTVTVPKDIEDLAVNLKAPLIINTETRKASQLIVESDYPVKFKIYDMVKNTKEKVGE